MNAKLPPGDIIIYLGPSLSIREARDLLDADYRPPIKRGDLAEFLGAPPQIVGIIDGEFGQNLSVSPKEILRLLDTGVTVFGASSMGALRAVELHPLGMIGVGRIFQMYKRGRINADDEVALVFSEDDGRPLSVPMVNIRFALNEAVERGIISPQEKQVLTRTAKRIYFPERSYPNLLKLAVGKIPERSLWNLREYLEQQAPDLKRADAILLLTEIKRWTTAASRRRDQSVETD